MHDGRRASPGRLVRARANGTGQTRRAFRDGEIPPKCFGGFETATLCRAVRSGRGWL